MRRNGVGVINIKVNWDEEPQLGWNENGVVLARRMQVEETPSGSFKYSGVTA